MYVGKLAIEGSENKGSSLTIKSDPGAGRPGEKYGCRSPPSLANQRQTSLPQSRRRKEAKFSGTTLASKSDKYNGRSLQHLAHEIWRFSHGDTDPQARPS